MSKKIENRHEKKTIQNGVYAQYVYYARFLGGIDIPERWGKSGNKVKQATQSWTLFGMQRLKSLLLQMMQKKANQDKRCY